MAAPQDTLAALQVVRFQHASPHAPVTVDGAHLCAHSHEQENVCNVNLIVCWNERWVERTQVAFDHLTISAPFALTPSSEFYVLCSSVPKAPSHRGAGNVLVEP